MQGFGKLFAQVFVNQPASYDLRTKYARLFGGAGSYQYSTRETIQAVRAYAQSEPLIIKSDTGVGK
jgi:hypothetical protein